MPQGQIRIIGGQWRGRKLCVPETPTVRPTPDRIRETLFNWLAPVISGAYCLDAFAGSGVLGFEALSRGAAHVVLVDQSKMVISLLQQELKLLKIIDTIEIYQASVPCQLKKPNRLFDIVFLDPPYQENLLLPTCFYLEENNFLSPEAYVYLETSKELQQTDLPSQWQLIKNKKAGQVAYYLARRYNQWS